MRELISLFVLTIISVTNLYAQENFGIYEFNYNSCVSPNDSVTVQPPYGVFSKFQRQNVFCDNAANNTWSSDGWSLNSTQDTNQYTYFSLTLDTPHTFHDTTILLSLTMYIKNHGPSSACIMYRFGSDAFQIVGAEWTPTTTLTPVTRTIPAPPDTNQTYLEVRFYGWGASSDKAGMSFDAVAFNGDSPLPVELNSFTSTVNDRNVRLNWSTAVEKNNAGFDVERKLSDGNATWSKIGFVQGNGTTNEPKNYSFEDKKLNTGKYDYRLKQIDYNNKETIFNLNNIVDVGIPKKSELSQNYPNPFNPITKIDYNITYNSKVTLKVFDITGREISTLVNETKEAGYYTVQFNASEYASGTYFYRITAQNGQDNFVMTKRMILIK